MRNKEYVFAVRVKEEARENVCSDVLICWVKNKNHEFYVSEHERGLWGSFYDASSVISEEWEEVVEIEIKTTNDQLKEFADRIETELNRNGDVVLECQEAERLVDLMRKAANEIFHFYPRGNDENN